MPELPEVQALVDDLGGRLIGRRVDRLLVQSFAALKTVDPPVSALSGQLVEAVARHGKFLDITVGGIHLIFDLARAGWVRWRENAPEPSKGLGKGPIAARLVLDDGSGFDLTEAGTKKSLAIYLVSSPLDVPGVARLGPDPLDPSFTVSTLAAILASQARARIKGVLRNQAIIAGIGNAYSDEILHVAKMSPFAAASMGPEDVVRLHEAIHATLRAALDRERGLPASLLKGEKKSNLRVHGRTGEACPFCGDTIRQVVYSDYTFQYCPTCQTGGKALADRVLSRLLK